MERDQGAWVVHRHVIDFRIDDAEEWSSATVPSPAPELLHDLGQLDDRLDAVPVLAAPGTLPSPRGGPSPAL